MAALQLKPALTTKERQQKQKLILQDVLALLSLSVIAIVLFLVTLFLFHSFTVHRQDLAQRWQSRGEAAMRNGQPDVAIDALRSALAYSPGNHALEIELAGALAAAGRTEEAVAYFNALREPEPGNGMINLQLARLAVRQKDDALAVEYYQAALDGTWEGDGYIRRREVRLELAHYLIGQQRFEQARTQLLIASGNAPDDPDVEMGIAALLESAHDPANALHLYQRALLHHPVRLAALEGAGRTAYALGRFARAKEYLERALNHPDFEQKPSEMQTQYRNLLADSVHILLLYPSPELSVQARAERILADKKIAQERLAACLSAATQVPPILQDLASQWQLLPTKITVLRLEQNPQLEQNIMQLVYKTEQLTSRQCGPPTGNDALLLKIAEAQGAIEQP